MATKRDKNVPCNLWFANNVVERNNKRLESFLEAAVMRWKYPTVRTSS